LPERSRWLLVIVVLFTAYLAFMVASHPAKYIVIARGVDAAGTEWTVAASSSETRIYGVTAWQSVDVQWVPLTNAPPGTKALPVLPVAPRQWHPDAPAPTGRFVPAVAGDTYARADFEDATVRAALAAPNLHAAQSRYLWQGIAIGIAVPTLVGAVAGLLTFFLLSLVPRDKSKCPECDYPIAGGRDGEPARQCPECGAPYQTPRP
jgi:hypothetical protein